MARETAVDAAKIALGSGPVARTGKAAARARPAGGCSFAFFAVVIVEMLTFFRSFILSLSLICMYIAMLLRAFIGVLLVLLSLFIFSYLLPPLSHSPSVSLPLQFTFLFTLSLLYIYILVRILSQPYPVPPLPPVTIPLSISYSVQI